MGKKEEQKRRTHAKIVVEDMFSFDNKVIAHGSNQETYNANRRFKYHRKHKNTPYRKSRAYDRTVPKTHRKIPPSECRRDKDANEVVSQVLGIRGGRKGALPYQIKISNKTKYHIIKLRQHKVISMNKRFVV